MKTISARERLEAAFGRIDDPKGEGARACLTIYREQAKAAADAADARTSAGISLGPLDGTIMTIKDLFDVAGEVTRAGSKALAEEAKPAATDAPVVRRLRAGGAVIAAPPARKRRTTGASVAAGLASSASALEPARVTSPATSNRSLMVMIVPSSGPSEIPALVRASAASAAAFACSR